MKIGPFVVIVCLAGIALACGQKGPLVMPDQQKHRRNIPAPPRAPVAAPGVSPPASPATPTSPAPAPSTPTPTDSSSHP